MHITWLIRKERNWRKVSTLTKTKLSIYLRLPFPKLSNFQAEELRYVYQRIGFQCFTETLFDDSGKHLFNGELDPRILISFYPDLRGSLFTSDDSIDMFAGIAEHMPKESSVDEISKHFLSALYVQ